MSVAKQLDKPDKKDLSLTYCHMLIHMFKDYLFWIYLLNSQYVLRAFMGFIVFIGGYSSMVEQLYVA
jgi:hypothetical protein